MTAAASRSAALCSFSRSPGSSFPCRYQARDACTDHHNIGHGAPPLDKERLGFSAETAGSTDPAAAPIRPAAPATKKNTAANKLVLQLKILREILGTPLQTLWPKFRKHHVRVIANPAVTGSAVAAEKTPAPVAPSVPSAQPKEPTRTTAASPSPAVKGSRCS